ncbi:MAG: diguanylate cyclase, partial [Myxococcota bacterium]
SVVALSVLFFFQHHAAAQEAVAEAALLGHTVTSLYQIIDGRQQRERARRVLLQTAHVSDVAAVDVLDPQGRVIDSTQPSHMGTQISLTPGTIWREDLVHVTHAAASQTGAIGGVRVSLRRARLSSGLVRLWLKLAVGFGLVVAFVSGLVLWVTDRVVGARLMRLATTMQDAEKAGFLLRAEVDRQDEVGLLGQAFNRMLEALTTMEASAIEHRRGLQAARKQLIMKAKLEKITEELRTSNQTLQRHVREQELLMQAAHELGATLNKEDLLQRLVQLIHHNLGRSDFAVFLVQRNPQGEKVLKLRVAHGWPAHPDFAQLRFALGEGVTGLVMQSKKPVVVENLSDEQQHVRLWRNSRGEPAEQLQRGSMLAVPMLHKGKGFGVMDFFSPHAYAFDREDQQLLHALGAQAAIAIANAQLYEETLRLSNHDPLTGLANRRALEQALREEIARSQRFAMPLSLMMIDVDNFKKYNDREGHVLGDEALKCVAKCLQENVRQVDRVSRYGGEEFCAILPQTTRDGAAYVAGKLRRAVLDLDIKGAQGQPNGRFSISIGVSQYPHDVRGSDNPSKRLVETADEALYQAKEDGRNRVQLYQRPLLRSLRGGPRSPVARSSGGSKHHER